MRIIGSFCVVCICCDVCEGVAWICFCFTCVDEVGASFCCCWCVGVRATVVVLVLCDRDVLFGFYCLVL